MTRGKGRSGAFPGYALLVVLAVLFLAGGGCLWGARTKGPVEPPPGEEGEVYTRIEEPSNVALPPLPGVVEVLPPASAAAAPGAPSAATGPAEAPRETEQPGAAGPPPAAPAPEAAAQSGSPGTAPPGGPPPEAPAPEAPPSAATGPAEAPASGAPHAQEAAKGAPPAVRAHKPRVAPPAAGKAVAQPAPEMPAWAVGKETLVYRIEFLGVTVGYARFTFKGRTVLNGREAYRLHVQAWSIGLLTLIYSGDTIDYYLDAETLAPLRQEFYNRGSGRDDVALYDQEKGKIVYRYLDTGEIRKRVDVPPLVYDPVSVAYFFRARDLGEEGRPRAVYAGRKVWEISAKLVGKERIETSAGPVDTLVIQPIIKREGKLEHKGDLRMWMTGDPRHVPVRLYAKFHKIRDWTLIAELLLPPRKGG